MTEIDPKVLAAIERFSATIGNLDPRVTDLLDQLKSGRPEDEVMADLIALTMNDIELSERIEQAARIELEPLRREADVDVKNSITALKKLKDRQSALRDLNFDEEDLLFKPEGVAFPQLHPVVMSYIIERLQFDDDIPELRTDNLPLGAMPAVPVENAARSPVALGMQMEKASSEVREQLDDQQRERAERLNAIGEAITRMDTEPGPQNDATTALARKAQTDFVAVSEGQIGVEGYKAGHKATPRAVALPTTTELATLTEDLRKKYAHKALTSTQGRRSAVPVIGALIQTELSQRGYTVTVDSRGTLLESAVAESSWTTSIETGSGEVQSRFSFIDTAAKVLAINLDRQLCEQGIKQILLHVEPVNQIAKRIVGWEAKAVTGQ